MASELRGAYSFLKYFSTKTHQEMCRDLTRRLRVKSESTTLVEWFVDSLTAQQDFDNRGEPFVGNHERTALSADSPGTNKIAFLLREQSHSSAVCIVDGPADYHFRYIGREVAPLRVTRQGKEFSAAGGIDYVGLADSSPVLGEIKCGSDQNPFYAFIQLLTYLSEIATPNQVARANQHQFFPLSIAVPTPFDLHILLADFNDRGKKKELNLLTQELAKKFKQRLQADHPEAAKWVGRILCLQLNGAKEKSDLNDGLKCLWVV